MEKNQQVLLKNEFIKHWLAAVPDQVAVCDDTFLMIGSSGLSKLDGNGDDFPFVIDKIKHHDFKIENQLIISVHKIQNRNFRVEVDQIFFNGSLCYYCKFIDTTELEMLNSELEQSRAQQINIARLTELAELAGGISHEISNPLTIVMAKISYLQSKLSAIDLGIDSEKITESLGKIIHHSNRITKIIKGLKNFSRNDDKELFVKADLKEMLDESFLLTIESIKLKGIQLDMQGFDGRFMVSCRPVQLVQVMVNLLKNSCDALEDTRQPEIKIFSESDGQYVRVFFQDNGPGIPEEIQSKIFNPFFTTKPTGKGTGLGLSLSHHIIRQHEGKLFLDLNHGSSCFCIQLRITL
ncbi:MAG: HAMP domain-containing histidine kinase [Bdellovibrio sp.]|nr:HAMP domain-containing histidine kinase [Bdellovibrio sp.]